MKDFIAEVIVIERRRIRVTYTGKAKLSREDMLQLLIDARYNDVIAEEVLDFVAVDSVAYQAADDE